MSHDVLGIVNKSGMVFTFEISTEKIVIIHLNDKAQFDKYIGKL